VNLKQLVFWITILAVFAMSARISVDTDTWWHLRAGQWMVENRAMPQTDPFSHTRYGEPWQYPGWLVEAPMYWIYQVFGPGGLNLWTATMVTLAFVFVWHTLVGGPFLRAFVVVLAAAVSGVFWAARPYLVTFLLAAVYLWALEAYRWRSSAGAWKRLWGLPLLMVLWVNSHGGFVVGFLIWSIYTFSDLLDMLWRRTLLSTVRGACGNLGSALREPRVVLWLVGPLMLLAVCINPYGAAMLGYPVKTVSIGALGEFIQEWQSPNFHQFHVQPFAWLLLLTFGVVGASRQRLALTDFLLVAGFAFMGLMAGRNIALFALAAPPALTRHAAALLEAWRPRSPAALHKKSWLNIVLLALVFCAVLAKISLVLPRAANEAFFRETLPVQAVAYLQAEAPPGQMFNSYNWGGYLLWALPEYPVFVDGRTDLYDDAVIGEWVQVMRAADGWQDVLDEYGVNLILVEAGSTLDRVLERELGWLNRYRDDQAVIYVRAKPVGVAQIVN
jgi:hypothetical protein